MFTTDVIVVGSGFGGAISAARLARHGLRGLVLERGPWWGHAGADRPLSDRREFPGGSWGSRKLLRGVRWTRGRRGRDILLRADGLFELHAFEHLDVGTGSGIGGGSLIYTNVLEAPDGNFFSAAFPPDRLVLRVPMFSKLGSEPTDSATKQPDLGRRVWILVTRVPFT